tara:strand:+ start:485 stop:850 length:366 start_codon:yes stop_codon:yes gene_type:complete
MVYFGIPVSYSYIEIVCMSQVIDRFEQELKNTNISKYIKSTDKIDENKIVKMQNRRNTLYAIINMMKLFSISESIWNKLTHEEIEEMAISFDANVVDYKTEIEELYTQVQNWEEWADRRPY